MVCWFTLVQMADADRDGKLGLGDFRKLVRKDLKLVWTGHERFVSAKRLRLLRSML